MMVTFHNEQNHCPNQDSHVKLLDGFIWKHRLIAEPLTVFDCIIDLIGEIFANWPENQRRSRKLSQFSDARLMKLIVSVWKNALSANIHFPRKSLKTRINQDFRLTCPILIIKVA
ncbi:hypothetical protein TcasGA2_TC013054 [Tribolium castaneum]|uniref:Uncharacterized protein n=1 Tax=Tribolium castaneum TaxID=7070 RepID=D6WJB7_TRICA|nr:hypothetical protein TcasGA2_TC013054 [Tribolium castaneum]